ncbi:MAG: nuclear transport factor 2 family protein [Cyanobacteria bacterium]|nr:nuclear transport factor 2 family protein [Cyanobacteriota bacterium]MEB3269705.1 nuclear transport factor 2 family protein [Leptolyngbya sp.]
MTPNQLDDFVAGFLQTWSRHDVDAIMALMTEDCEFEPSARAWGTHYQGQAEVRAAVEGLFKSAPDIQWRAVRYWATADQVVIEVLATGTNAQGEPFEIPGCDLLTLREGKIASKRAYRKL